MYQYENWVREPDIESVEQHLQYYLFSLIQLSWVPRSSHNAFSSFSLNFFLFLVLLRPRVCGIKPPQPHFLLFSFSLNHFSFIEGCGIELVQPHFIFLLNFLYSAEMSSVRIPHALTFIFLLIFS